MWKVWAITWKMYNVEDLSSSYMDKDSEMCVHCQSQNVPQSDSKKLWKFDFIVLMVRLKSM